MSTLRGVAIELVVPLSEPAIEELCRHFASDGWAHWRGAFAPTMVEELDGRVRDHYGASPDRSHDDAFVDGAGVDVVPWFPQREGDTTFDVVEQDVRLRAVTDALLGEGWRSDYVMAMYSGAGTVGQAWHQDCPPENPDVFNINRLVYTHDITPETGGALVVVPGSHQRGAISAGAPHEDFADQVRVRPQAGDVVFVHGHTWHRVMAVGERPRVSTNFRAVPAGVPDGITDVCVYRTMRYRFSTAEVVEHR